MAEGQERNDAEIRGDVAMTSRPDNENGLQSIIGNMVLAHEMIVNDDFRLEEFQENT